MQLSPKQLGEFFGRKDQPGLWPRYCIKQGWTTAAGLTTKQIDEHRREFLRSIGFASLKDVDRVDGYTRVRNELKALLHDDIDAARETAEPEINRARVLRHKIRTEIMPCLALYTGDADVYVQTVITGLTRWNKTDRPTVAVTLDDLDDNPVIKTVGNQLKESPSKLKQALMTLQARLNVLRNQAGDSIHDMKTKAGLACWCAQCKRRKNPVKKAEILDPERVPF